MSDTVDTRIIFPAGAFGCFNGEETLDTAMRIIAVGFDFNDEWSEKYGTDFENSTFMMKPFCWCEKENICPWCTGCHCSESCFMAGERVASECDYCTGSGIFTRFAPWNREQINGPRDYNPPNFWYKPSDFRLTWYKYIGRSMSFNRPPPEDLLESVFATHPHEMTVKEAISKLAEHQRETEQTVKNLFLGGPPLK